MSRILPGALRKTRRLFIGQWVPTFFVLGIALKSEKDGPDTIEVVIHCDRLTIRSLTLLVEHARLATTPEFPWEARVVAFHRTAESAAMPMPAGSSHR
jgi:hypothetical protein